MCVSTKYKTTSGSHDDTNPDLSICYQREAVARRGARGQGCDTNNRITCAFTPFDTRPKTIVLYLF